MMNPYCRMSAFYQYIYWFSREKQHNLGQLVVTVTTESQNSLCMTGTIIFTCSALQGSQMIASVSILHRASCFRISWEIWRQVFRPIEFLRALKKTQTKKKILRTWCICSYAFQIQHDWAQSKWYHFRSIAWMFYFFFPNRFVLTSTTPLTISTRPHHRRLSTLIICSHTSPMPSRLLYWTCICLLNLHAHHWHKLV